MKHGKPKKQALAIAYAARKRMSQGGEVESLEEDRKLAENDTYPPGAAESDTQAQDEGFGEGEMNNEIGNEDQEEARKKRVKRALMNSNQ